jgi:hypothetical protein
MQCRKAGFVLSLILAFISATGYVCTGTVYAARTGAVMFRAAAEHTGAVAAGSGMSAPNPICNEISSSQKKQPVPFKNPFGIDFYTNKADFDHVFRYSPKYAYLPLPDVYTQFENKYRDTILILQTLI